MNENKLMSAEELADYLQVPLQTLYGWRYERKGPSALKIGKHLRYRRSEVERWLDEQGATAGV